MGVRRKAAGLAVAATMLCAAAPAAADQLIYEARSFNPSETIDATTARVALECDATAVGAFSNTAITECYLHGLTDGANYPIDGTSLPGLVAATAGAITVPNQPYEACVSVAARSILGNSEINGPVRCFRS